MSLNNPHAPAAPSFSRALAYWLWLGCISFGGPAQVIPVVAASAIAGLLG